ncbi:MAG TPA: response regulator, partial [candidate division Zixibacteria bacterium]|nr:response regulator [candidate division Zixibacteria bacterium]
MKNILGRLLIVDDDPLVLDALRETFIDEYDILAASSGPEALDRIGENDDIDAIVLDIKMARMDGLETASRIKEINPEIPIIFHTGYPGAYSEQEIEKGYHPFDYVGKNERPARLQRAVKNAVSFHKLRTSQSTLVDLARREYGLVGKSSGMLEVYRKIEKIGPTDNKVM